MIILPHCDACREWKLNVKDRYDWSPPRPMCDECYEMWWRNNKDELG